MICAFKIFCAGSPAFSPGWQYNLNGVMELKATSDFLKLENKGCSFESKEDCSLRNHISTVTQKCGCLPLNIRTKEYSQEIFN